MKRKVLKSSINLPTTISNKSLNLKSEISKSSLKIQQTLNLRTENNHSAMSLNNRFKNQLMTKSRNNPYNAEDGNSFDTFSYSPLVKGMKSAKQDGAYMNSFIGANRSVLSKHVSIRTPHLGRPGHYYGKF